MERVRNSLRAVEIHRPRVQRACTPPWGPRRPSVRAVPQRSQPVHTPRPVIFPRRCPQIACFQCKVLNAEKPTVLTLTSHSSVTTTFPSTWTQAITQIVSQVTSTASSCACAGSRTVSTTSWLLATSTTTACMTGQSSDSSSLLN